MEPRRGDERGPDLEPLPPPRGCGWVRWADLLRRVFEIDALECARCGGRLRGIAVIDDPQVVRRILGHLGPADRAAPAVASPPAAAHPELPFGWE